MSSFMNFRRHEQNLALLITAGPQMMPDRGRQVGLAETDTAIDKQRIIFFPRLMGGGLRRRMRELIARTDHELRKGVAWGESRMQLVARGARGGSGAGLIRCGARLWGAAIARRARVVAVAVYNLPSITAGAPMAIAGCTDILAIGQLYIDRRADLR
jgi:hypothetical protein